MNNNIIEKFTIGNLNIDFHDIQQVIGMGGPWVGRITIGKTTLNGLYVISEPVLSSNEEYLGLVSYRPKTRFLGITHFKLVLLDIASGKIFEHPKKFHALCIDKIENERLVIYESFHKELPQYKNIIPFQISDFKVQTK